MISYNVKLRWLVVWDKTCNTTGHFNFLNPNILFFPFNFLLLSRHLTAVLCMCFVECSVLFLPVVHLLTAGAQSFCSLSPWPLDIHLFICHYEWCCAGCRGCCCFLLGLLPSAALWRFAEAAVDGSARDVAVLVPLLPHRLHPATWCQHGMKPLQIFLLT